MTEPSDCDVLGRNLSCRSRISVKRNRLMYSPRFMRWGRRERRNTRRPSPRASSAPIARRTILRSCKATLRFGWGGEHARQSSRAFTDVPVARPRAGPVNSNELRYQAHPRLCREPCCTESHVALAQHPLAQQYGMRSRCDSSSKVNRAPPMARFTFLQPADFGVTLPTMGRNSHTFTVVLEPAEEGGFIVHGSPSAGTKALRLRRSSSPDDLSSS